MKTTNFNLRVFRNRSRAFLLKAALERSKCSKKKVIGEIKSQSSSFDSPIEPTNHFTPVDENDEDMKELLQLASASTNEERITAFKENVPKMLKLSKLAQLIEEGITSQRKNIQIMGLKSNFCRSCSRPIGRAPFTNA